MNVQGLQASCSGWLQAAGVRTITVPADIACGHRMHYRAVPLVALLGGVSSSSLSDFGGRGENSAV